MRFRSFATTISTLPNEWISPKNAFLFLCKMLVPLFFWFIVEMKPRKNHQCAINEVYSSFVWNIWYRNGWKSANYIPHFQQRYKTPSLLPLLLRHRFLFSFFLSFSFSWFLVCAAALFVYIIFRWEYIVTWFLKCILRFWIHGRYSSSSNNTNNSNSILPLLLEWNG